MAFNPLYTIEKLPTTSAAAIREFNDRYIASVGAAQPTGWVEEIGDVGPTNSPHVTFPVSEMALKYQQTMGESRFKTLAESSFDLKVEEFDEGISARLLDLFTQSFAYRKWNMGPSRLLAAEKQLVTNEIVTLLEAGETTPLLWADPTGATFFFDTTIPANFADAQYGTWSNLNVAALDVVNIANIQAQVTIMQGAVLGEQGLKLGADPDTILVPTPKYEPLKNLLAQARILDDTGTTSIAVDNPYQGKFKVVHGVELTDVNDWYLIDSKLLAQAMPPWIALRYVVPTTLGLRNYDESTDYFKDTGRIKISSHVWWGTTLGFPHGIRKVTGA